jgi:hypothetical protein
MVSGDTTAGEMNLCSTSERIDQDSKEHIPKEHKCSQRGELGLRPKVHAEENEKSTIHTGRHTYTTFEMCMQMSRNILCKR